MPITGVDFIAIFIVEKGSDVFQGFCNCAFHQGAALL
jgi:hypothetical protein